MSGQKDSPHQSGGKPETLPLSKGIAYAIGQLGWATLMMIVNLQLVYFYIPPYKTESGPVIEGAETVFPIFITQASFFIVFNAIMLITGSGRIFDGITDPLIAGLSDRSRNPRGRRIPFLMYGSIPAALFCFLLFVPWVPGESIWNIVGLLVIQFFFFVSITMYVTPFFALIAELGHTPRERLNLSTYISITYALGIIIASQVPAIAGQLENALQLEAVAAFQWAIGLLAVLATIFMLVPVFIIDERRYCVAQPADIPIMQSIKECLANKNFLPYVAADFVYFGGLSIIMTGMNYYVTVLVGLEKEWVGLVMTIIVLSSFIWYPLVNILAKKFGKKAMVLLAFFIFCLPFGGIYFLGRLPIAAGAQILIVGTLASIPMAFLGVLPNAVLADIAELDALQTGKRREGMYYAARTFLQKMGQTIGLMLFASLANFGVSTGDDLGLRLNGIAGVILCGMAFLFFARYREKQILAETEKLQQTHG